MRKLLLVTVTFLGISASFAASNAERSDCIDKSKEPSTRIPACTRIIENLGEDESERVAAYVARAAVNYRTGNYDAAISKSRLGRSINSVMIRSNVASCFHWSAVHFKCISGASADSF